MGESKAGRCNQRDTHAQANSIATSAEQNSETRSSTLGIDSVIQMRNIEFIMTVKNAQDREVDSDGDNAINADTGPYAEGFNVTTLDSTDTWHGELVPFGA